MPLKTHLTGGIISLLLLSTNFNQTKDVAFYRQDLGIYFHFDKSLKKQKIPFKENWDFFFSLKNDSIATIQDVKNKVLQPSKEYKISSSIDSTFVRYKANGKQDKIEVMYFKKLYQ
jgi:hypothetical protein